MSHVFIGQLIEHELRSQERSVAWLAGKLNCNRTNVYKIFRRKSVDAELLLKISNILCCNFFSVYTDRLDAVRDVRFTADAVAAPETAEAVTV